MAEIIHIHVCVECGRLTKHATGTNVDGYTIFICTLCGHVIDIQGVLKELRGRGD